MPNYEPWHTIDEVPKCNGLIMVASDIYHRGYMERRIYALHSSQFIESIDFLRKHNATWRYLNQHEK